MRVQYLTVPQDRFCLTVWMVMNSPHANDDTDPGFEGHVLQVQARHLLSKAKEMLRQRQQSLSEGHKWPTHPDDTGHAATDSVACGAPAESSCKGEQRLAIKR